MVGKQESSTRALRSHKSWVQRLDTAIANITAEKSLEVWLQTELESPQSLYHSLLNGDFRSLQVDLGEVKTITAFATQGNTVRQRDARLREYYIQYGDTGTDWLNYTYEGKRKARCSTMCWSTHIECFHSRSQHLYKFIGKKGSVCIRKEFNSQRIGLGHQHGRRDVMWKHSISYVAVALLIQVCTLHSPLCGNQLQFPQYKRWKTSTKSMNHCERSLSPMILVCNQMVYTRKIKKWFHLRFVQILIIWP